MADMEIEEVQEEQPAEEEPEEFGIFNEEDPEEESEAPAEEPEEESANEEEPPSDDPAARLQADLDRRDAELLQRERNLRQYEQEVQRLQQLQDAARTDPAKAMDLLGADRMRLLESLIGNTEEQDPNKQQAQTLEEMKAELKQLKDHTSQAEQDRAVEAEHAKIGHALTASAEELPLLNALQSDGTDVAGLVFERAKAYWQEHHQRPNFPELLKEVEQERFKATVSGISRALEVPSLAEQVFELPAIKEKLAAPKSKPKGQAAPSRQTLSGDMEQEPEKRTRDMSEDELDAEFAEFVRSGKLWE